MTAATAFPSMGATLFVGLTGVALITHVPPTEYANPRETMPPFEAPPAEVDYVAPVSWAVVLDPPEVSPVADPDTLAETSLAGRLPDALPGVLPTPDIQIAVTVPGLAREGGAPVVAPAGAPPTSGVDPDALRRADGANVYEPDEGPAPVNAMANVTANAAPDLSEDWRPAQALRPALARALPSGVPAPGTASETPEAARANVAAVLAGDRVHLRAAPRITANSLAQYDTGTPAIIRERRGDWRRVEIEGRIGWMFGAYLDPNEIE